MRFFVDTAKVEDIRKANDMGVICGVTTNPSLIAKEGRDFQEVIREITEIVDGPVSGEVKDYRVEILEIHGKDEDMNKGIILKVTDPELLDLTGGIVQGMSGSPIIQNGKLVGAVTHVFVQDSTKGFGVFIENMLEHVNL